MQHNQEKSEQIERYLAGAMTPAERLAFEAEMQKDATLADAVSLQQALQQSLGNHRRRQLLDALNGVARQEETKSSTLTVKWLSGRRLAVAAAILALLAAIGTWQYLRQTPDAPALAEQPAPQPQPNPDSVQNKLPPAPGQPEQPQPSRLASADRAAFAPNPALDPMAGTLVRGGATDLTVSQPKNNTNFPLVNGMVNFNLTGQSKDLTAFNLQIFNNKEADFAAGKPVYRAEIPVQEQGFSWKNALKLTPGRYYAVLSAPGEEEPELVLRFFVGKGE